MDIRFDKGEHGDGDAHDGKGKVLAHGYFPQFGGDVHFDDDEDWTMNSTNGTVSFASCPRILISAFFKRF